MLPRLECHIENRAGTKQGEGPLVNVPWLRYAHRLGQAGDFETMLPLADERTVLVAEKTSVLRFFWNGLKVFVGVVEETGRQVMQDGTLHLPVRGRCLGGAELSEASVDFLELTDGSGGGVNDGPADILTAANVYTPGTWSLDTTAGYATTSTDLYAKFAGESALSALVKSAEKIGERWRFSTTDDRKIVWLRATAPSSGIRAIDGAPNMVQAEGNPEICFFDSFEEERDVHGLFTRIYPYGGGNVEIATKLTATSRTAGAGFTLSVVNNYIESDNATTAIGHVIPKHVQFPDIRPVSNTDADIESAADALYDSALAMLQRHDSVDDFRVFRLGGIVQLPTVVLPGTTLRVVYEDERYNVDEEFFVLEVASAIDQAGRHTHSLAVGAVDRLPPGEGGSTANGLEDGRLWQTHPIRNVNSYEIGVYRPVWYDGSSESAYIYFDFDAEVTEVQQVRLKFETDGGSPVVMKPLESTVRSVGGGASVDVTVDSLDVDVSTTVSVSGTIDIRHVHDVPEHYHSTVIVDGSAFTLVGNASLYTSGGIYYIGHNAGGGSHPVLTKLTGEGATTAASGGSASLALTGTGSGTGTGTGTGSGTADLSSAISAAYGIFRESAGNTFYLEDLRYRVNGGSWAALVLSGGGQNVFPLGGNRYYLDITSQVMDANRRPNQASNVLEIARIDTGIYGDRVSCMVDGTLKIRTIVQSTAAS